MALILETNPPVELKTEGDDKLHCKVNNVISTFDVNEDVAFVPSSEPLQTYPLGNSTFVIISSKDHVKRASVLHINSNTSKVRWLSMKKACPEFWTYGNQLARVSDASAILEALRMVNEIQTIITKPETSSDETFGIHKLSLQDYSSVIHDFSDATIQCQEGLLRPAHLMVLAMNWPWVRDKLPRFKDIRDRTQVNINVEGADSQTIDVLVDHIYGESVKSQLNVDIILFLARFDSAMITIASTNYYDAQLPPGLWEACLSYEPQPSEFGRMWRVDSLKEKMETYFKLNKKEIIASGCLTFLTQEELLELLKI